MKKLWLILAISAWIFIFLPLVLVWQEVIPVAESYQLMAVGALLWIVSRWGLRQSKKGSGKR